MTKASSLSKKWITSDIEIANSNLKSDRSKIQWLQKTRRKRARQSFKIGWMMKSTFWG